MVSVCIDGEARGFTLVKVKGDGACLFNALSMGMSGTEVHAHAIRSDIVAHVLNWFEDFQESICLAGEASATPGRYAQFMGKPHEYGTFVEITAAAALFQRRICLLPTRHKCEQLNTAMINSIEEPVIHIDAVDTIDCPLYLTKRAEECLHKYDDESSMTAGLDRRIVIKVGARIMLRRNIDLTLGLVSGAIGTVPKVIFDIDNCSLIRRLQVQFNHGLVYDLERVSTKFEVLPRVFVHREHRRFLPKFLGGLDFEGHLQTFDLALCKKSGVNITRLSLSY
ncbi:hypothetical protein M8J77_019875 [Diaphorina citri]|nr:hypothetical protein M8J77_019875 [Diaphorina citri]